MAICFEPAVDFGGNDEAARATALSPRIPAVLPAGGHAFPLHRPSIHPVGSHAFLVLQPVAVSRGAANDGTLPRVPLGAAELSELGHRLYEVLGHFEGYRAALVGWDPESLLDPAELPEALGDRPEGGIKGLVLSERLHTAHGLGDEYVGFRPGHRRVPYEGERAGGLTDG